MSKKNTIRDGSASHELEEQEFGESIRVEDRRHWQRPAEDAEASDGTDDDVKVSPQPPSIIDEYRGRAEEAERKLLDYIEAFKRHKLEQEQVRERLARDVERRVELKFGELVQPLLEVMDDLERSMSHMSADVDTEPLLRGVRMTHALFLSTLEKFGVTKFSPDGQPFDPTESEALRVDPVDSTECENRVTETLKPGYRLGERVLRAAQVAVGRIPR